MNKLKILIIIFLLLFFSDSALAQSRETLDQFAEIQRTLAGDPSEWNFRRILKDKDPEDPTGEKKLETGWYYHVPVDPAKVLDVEDRGRMLNSFDTDPSGTIDRIFLKYAKLYFDEESMKNAVIRDGLNNKSLFAGDYKLKSNKTSELEIIKDIYEQITSRTARYEAPSDESLSGCLAENKGVCRQMATILQESLEDYGIKSEQIFSPTHTWVRVTLSDPRYKDNLFSEFDLDPTWYANPVPLPPRKGFLISEAWKKAMTAQVTQTPTPSISVTPTPTFTPTPTLTPTPTPESESDTSPPAYEGSGSGGAWTESR